MAWIHQIAEICQRWGGMGRQDRWRHGCRHRAPMDGFTACPAVHAAPPTHGTPAVAVAVASAIAVVGGCRAQPCRKTHIKQQAEACCFGVVRPRSELPTAWFVARYSIQLSYGRQHKLVVLTVYGAPGEIRTPDRLVRSQVLYPTELRARGTQSNFTAFPAADAGNLSSGAPGEIELPTAWFVARYSIQLSYGRPATGAELCDVGADRQQFCENFHPTE